MLKINLVYHGKCFNENNRHDYIGGTDNRIEQQIIDHNKLDKISHFLRIARKIEHHHIWHNDFKISEVIIVLVSKWELVKPYLLSSLNRHLVNKNNRFTLSDK